MEIKISVDEYYPFYFVGNEHAQFKREVTQEQLDWIEKTLDEFGKVQDFLEKKVKEINYSND